MRHLVLACAAPAGRLTLSTDFVDNFVNKHILNRQKAFIAFGNLLKPLRQKALFYFQINHLQNDRLQPRQLGQLFTRCA
jgi:hypothetical protein